MPHIFYIKYFDLTRNDGNAFRTEWFLDKKHAKIRRDELLQELKEMGGSENCDMDYKGGIGDFYYRCQNTLLWELEKLNDIFTT